MGHGIVQFCASQWTTASVASSDQNESAVEQRGSVGGTRRSHGSGSERERARRDIVNLANGGRQCLGVGLSSGNQDGTVVQQSGGLPVAGIVQTACDRESGCCGIE